MIAPVDQTSIDRVCEDMYREAQEFLQEIHFEPPFGLKILNGPPIVNAKILFIGYQPAGGKAEKEKEEKISVHNGVGTQNGWPLECEYATADWKLARQMRRVFGEQRLKQCVGTNVIFLRYPNEKCYRKHVGEKREQIENFCIKKVRAIIDAIKPKSIVTIGFQALKMFGRSENELLRQNGKHALTKTVRLAENQPVGIIHLGGGYGITEFELTQLAAHFKDC